MKKYFLVLLLTFLSLPLFLNSTKAFTPEKIIISGLNFSENSVIQNLYWTRQNEDSAYYILDLDGSHTIGNGLMTVGNSYVISSTNTNFRYLEFVTPQGTFIYDLLYDYLELYIDNYYSVDDIYTMYIGDSEFSNTCYIRDGFFRILSNNLQSSLNYEVYSKGFEEGKNVGLIDGGEIGFIEGYNAGLLQSQTDSYDTGYAEGSLDGFNEGYFIGLNDPENPELDVRYDMGYNTGYADGVSAQLDEDVSGFFGSIFSFIGGIFSTQIFPGLTIGLLASIPIMLAVLRWFFMSLGKKD